MARIIFDIETIGEDFEKMDKKTKEVLKEKVERIVGDPKDKKAMKEGLVAEKEKFGLSPLTGEIVSIGMLDADTKKGAVYFQAPDAEVEDFEEEGIKYKAMTEKEIIEGFWEVARHADEFVSFNGRPFDVPFILVRGAIHSIRPTKDLMSNRYLNVQKFGSKHIDLLDQLTFYGSVWNNKGSLHMWSRAFGIKSPKEEGVNGGDVAKLFKEKKYLEIAQYNARDLYSTRDLFEYWDKFLRF
ncbi:hypothetical protein HN784_03185 [bacterium]|jgi:3'-5' exonuclease|nr:hypothetical protein [bacterium]MBT4251298.1 hypothetical protein [bacterium]MBT4598321.1 hypothetical protein [bacterium]MBT6754154.1 hypothetical protein [bacterium]MBT7037974.1 hypothetical protein [bacterium]